MQLGCHGFRAPRGRTLSGWTEVIGRCQLTRMSINRLHFKACEAVIWNENEDYWDIPYASYVDRISGRSRNDRIWTSLVQVALVLALDDETNSGCTALRMLTSWLCRLVPVFRKMRSR